MRPWYLLQQYMSRVWFESLLWKYHGKEDNWGNKAEATAAQVLSYIYDIAVNPLVNEWIKVLGLYDDRRIKEMKNYMKSHISCGGAMHEI